MSSRSIVLKLACAITIVAGVLFSTRLSAQSRDVNITIYLRGVYESKISLLALSSSRTYKPILELTGIRDGHEGKFLVDKAFLPGEFVLRFDYKETEASTPYPSEKNVFISDQDLLLWVNPKYSNNGDSTWFQKDEKENSAFVRFSKENSRQKEKLGLLQNFLMNYDEPESGFYKQGVKEYELRRQAYNQWLAKTTRQDKSLFVSNLYPFQYVPQISYSGTETDRVKSVIDHYFDGMDFQDPLLLKTAVLNKWMDNYVNLYGQLATTIALRDSLFPAAGQNAIEKARKGHPLFYGWMVDYFYRGYETNGINAGMKILEPYLNDTNCMTTKRQEIGRRLKGIETLVPGSIAPEIRLMENDGMPFELSTLKAPGKFILVLFWSAGCSHCVELADQLYPWQQRPEFRDQIMVAGISLDESETDIDAWEQKIKTMKGWTHLHSGEGVNGKTASDYYILATPVMVLIDAKTKKIMALPNTLDELKKAVLAF